jgi:long-chain acyl-CoA synthetase
MTIKPWEFLNNYSGSEFTGEWPTLPEMLKITTLRYPERKAFTTYSPDLIELNYSQVLEKSEMLGQYLHITGVKKGDRIGVTGKNSPEWALAYLGILFAEAVVVPIDYSLNSSEIYDLLKVTEVDILFCDEEKIDFFQEKEYSTCS